MTGFEPATSRSRTVRSTKLSYIPMTMGTISSSCIGRQIPGNALLIQPIQNEMIPIGTIVQAALDTAYCGGTGACFRFDVAVCLTAFQHTSHLEPLSQRLHFSHCTQIVKKTITLFHCLQF